MDARAPAGNVWRVSLAGQKRFNTLLDLADEADKRNYSAFANYCRLREEGARAEAFKQLEKFVAHLEKQPFPARRAFSGWLLGFSFFNPQVIEACPVLLRANIVAPAIEEWIRSEPDNPQALRWSTDERAVLIAVRLAPHDEIAVGRFATMKLARIQYAAHEEPGSYPADALKQDLLDLEAVLALIDASRAEALADLRDEALELKAALQQQLKA
jgi:hypothetical protein